MKRIDFARLNHILIPSTKTGRDVYRHGRLGWVARPMERTYRALSAEGRVFMALWIIVSAMGASVRAHKIYVLWALVTGILVVSLLVRRWFRLSDVSLSVEHAPRVAVGDSMQISLRVKNNGPKEHAMLRVDGPLLPYDGSYLDPSPSAPILPSNGAVDLTVSVTFTARGEHHLDPLHVGQLVPFGLCVGPTLKTEGLRFLVVPKPARVESLQLAMGPSYQPGGVALASTTGEARELAGLRPYRPGDPVRDLCPRAWARLGTPVVREYQQEFFTRFGVILDTDVSEDGPAVLEAGVALAAGAIAHLSRGEALVDLLVVGDSLHRMTVGRNLGFLEQALDVLAMVEPGPTFDANRLEQMVQPHLRRLSALLLVTARNDGARVELVRRIKRQNLGVRTFVVGEGRGVTPLGPDVTGVGMESVAEREALRL